MPQRSLAPALLAALLAAPLASAQSNLTAWHRDGQTFLVWDVDQNYAGLESVSIYRSSAPIASPADLARAELAGRLYPQDWRAARLSASHPGATWTIPSATGQPLALGAQQGLFVYTPHAAQPEHFAVVKTELLASGPFSSTGPIAQGQDPVRPHLQKTGIDGGHPYRLYALWADGRADADSGRVDFPVMGPAHSAGIAHLYCVFEPAGPLPPAPRPTVLFLHGGGGSYWTYRPSQAGQKKIDLEVENGLYVTFDSHVFLRAGGQVNSNTAGWFGSCENYDRFEEPSIVPPDGTRVIDYSQRRMAWILDWLEANLGADPQRTAMAGLSGGGRGTHLFARARPERLSASLSFVMPTNVFNDEGPALWGTFEQNLPTNLPGAPGAIDTLLATTLLSPLDLPFQRFVDGTTDTEAPWPGKPPTYDAFEAWRSGAAIYWDQRGHTASSPTGWVGAQFVGSPKHSMAELTRHRADRSFPAFHSVDHNLAAPQQQPDPGDPVLPPNGAPFGTWGGWFDWDPDSIVDQPQLWSARLWLVTNSPFPADNAPQPQARVSVTLRRLQAFAPQPGEALRFRLALDQAPFTQLTTGLLAADSLGRLTVPNLILGAQPVRLSVEPLATGLGLSLYGQASAGCAGLPAIGAAAAPSIGNPAFALLAANLPPGAPGLFALAAAPADLPLLGIDLLVELSSPPALLSGALASPAGNALWSLPIPNQPQLAGQRLYAQGAWIDPCGSAGWSASRGLELTLLP